MTPVTFSHGWPLFADAREAQMMRLASNGFRVTAHDRRGHGWSSQPWPGNDMDTCADDLHAPMEHLDLRGTIMVRHLAGGGKVARTIGGRGTARVAKAVLVSAVPPIMLKTPACPGGLPIAVFGGIRAGLLKDRSQFSKDLTLSFCGANRGDHQVSPGMRDSFWLQVMMGGFKNLYGCVNALSETDFTGNPKRMTIPALVIHGDDDQIVPIGNAGELSAKIAPDARLKVHAGGSHGLAGTERDRLTAACWNPPAPDRRRGAAAERPRLCPMPAVNALKAGALHARDRHSGTRQAPVDCGGRLKAQ